METFVVPSADEVASLNKHILRGAVIKNSNMTELQLIHVDPQRPVKARILVFQNLECNNTTTCILVTANLSSTHLEVAVLLADPGVLGEGPVLGGAAAHERLAQDLLVLPLGLRLLAALHAQQFA